MGSGRFKLLKTNRNSGGVEQITVIDQTRLRFRPLTACFFQLFRFLNVGRGISVVSLGPKRLTPKIPWKTHRNQPTKKLLDRQKSICPKKMR